LLLAGAELMSSSAVHGLILMRRFGASSCTQKPRALQRLYPAWRARPPVECQPSVRNRWLKTVNPPVVFAESLLIIAVFQCPCEAVKLDNDGDIRDSSCHLLKCKNPFTIYYSFRPYILSLEISFTVSFNPASVVTARYKSTPLP
jgi:hypothetical protein